MFCAVPAGLAFFIVIQTQDFRPGLYYDAPAGLSYGHDDPLCPGDERQGASSAPVTKHNVLLLHGWRSARSFDSLSLRCAQCALAQYDIRVMLSGTAVLRCLVDCLGVKLGVFAHHQVQGKILFHIAAQGCWIKIQLGHALGQFAH